MKITKIFICLLLLIPFSLSADESLGEKLAGQILLQVESRGEAWYINPKDNKKYYLGRPADAWQVMRELGIGITDQNLDKIALGFLETKKTDTDNDGLSDDFESAIYSGTDNPDSDNDGYLDGVEVAKGYDPRSQNSSLDAPDEKFSRENAGKIFLQVENRGEAWYINPQDLKRYFLGRPDDAWQVMRLFGLGITNNDLSQITIGYLKNQESNIIVQPQPTTNEEEVIYQTASAIRNGNKALAKSYFTENLQNGVEYTMNFLNADGKLTLGNILSGSKLASATDTEKIYTNEVYFSLNGKKVPVKFIVKKQSDGTWRMTNL